MKIKDLKLGGWYKSSYALHLVQKKNTSTICQVEYEITREMIKRQIYPESSIHLVLGLEYIPIIKFKLLYGELLYLNGKIRNVEDYIIVRYTSYHAVYFKEDYYQKYFVK
jgi:hypothetical protein